jgi:hypothetical protein
MALKLDNNLIDELGLGALPEQEKQLLLRQIYEKLEMNVGVRLADQMSNDQLDEFEKFVDANDDKGAFQWLETNFPNYKDVVNEEFEKLKAEIKQYAPQMLAVAQHNSQQAAGASQQAAAGGQQQAPQGMPGGQYPPQQPQYNPTGHPQPGQYQQPQPQYNPTNPTNPAGHPGQNGYGQGQPVQQPYYGPQPGQPQYNPGGQPQPGQGQQYQPPFPGQGQPQYPPYPPQQPPAGPNQ